MSIEVGQTETHTLALGKETKTKLEDLSSPQIIGSKRKSAQTYTNFSIFISLSGKTLTDSPNPPNS